MNSPPPLKNCHIENRNELERARGTFFRCTLSVKLRIAKKYSHLHATFLELTHFPFNATFFDKSPDSNWLVAWHQDTALPLTEKCEIPGWGPWSLKGGVNYAHAPSTALEQVLALRVYLDNSTAENGPLRVIPGTHGCGVLTDAEIQERVGDAAGVACTVPAGGVVAMRPLVIHASSKSESELPRRVLHIEYATSRRIADGLELALV